MKHLGRICLAFALGLALFPVAEAGAVQAQPVEGARIRFEVQRFSGKVDRPLKARELQVFTPRPHLLAGASFVLVAPEHPMLQELTTPILWNQVKAYVEEAKKKPFAERTDPTRKITGKFLGSYVVQPLNGWRIPVWVSDYVAEDYPLQACLGIPAHDAWQFAFARAHGIDVVPVIRVRGENGESVGGVLRKPYSGTGTLMDSGELTGVEVTNAKGQRNPAFAAIVQWLKAHGRGEPDKGVDYVVWTRAQRKTGGEKEGLAKKTEPVGRPLAKGVQGPAEAKKGEALLKDGASAVGTGLGERASLRGSARRKGETEVEAATVKPREPRVRKAVAEHKPERNRMVDSSWMLSKPRMGTHPAK